MATPRVPWVHHAVPIAHPQSIQPLQTSPQTR